MRSSSACGSSRDMTQAIKFCERPVVAAPFGLCLGGGTEVCMHAALRQPHLELYTGLVETGVGLIPGGGGCKEMLLRALAAADAVRSDVRGESVEVVETVKNVFETIAMAKVSTSAMDARSLRIIEDIDSISMNRSRAGERRQGPGPQVGAIRIHGASDENEYSRAGRDDSGDTQAWHLPDARGRLHQRP